MSRLDLIALRDGATLKPYDAEPSRFVVYGDYVVTCAIEKVLDLEQPTVAISRTDKGRIRNLDAVIDEFASVFGRPKIFWKANYPKRGETVLWVYQGRTKP